MTFGMVLLVYCIQFFCQNAPTINTMLDIGTCLNSQSIFYCHFLHHTHPDQHTQLFLQIIFFIFSQKKLYFFIQLSLIFR